MRATVQIGKWKATIQDYKWSSKNKKLAQMLNSLLAPGGPSGADPAPCYHAALEAVEQLGGRIIDFELPKYDPKAIY